MSVKKWLHQMFATNILLLKFPFKAHWNVLFQNYESFQWQFLKPSVWKHFSSKWLKEILDELWNLAADLLYYIKSFKSIFHSLLRKTNVWAIKKYNIRFLQKNTVETCYFFFEKNTLKPVKMMSTLSDSNIIPTQSLWLEHFYRHWFLS